MLTRQGWAVIWAGLFLPAIGRIFGVPELYVFGAAAFLLATGSFIYVNLARLDLEVYRRVHPSAVHAGSTSRVEIRARNIRGQATPVLRLYDQVSGTKGAEMLVPPIEPGGEAVAGYRLPTGKRGVLRVGPLRIVVADPFGLARSSVLAAQQVEVTVYPKVDDVQPVPFTIGHDPLAGTRRLHSLSHSGDDFYALRPYVMGDDLRRIHWPSTARHDELLVSQHEKPRQGRTTILVDIHSAVHSPDALEIAISAAASLATANMKRNDLVRLITTDGRDSGFGMGRTHLTGMMEHLALIKASSRASLSSTVELLERDKGSGGALVAIVGDLPDNRAAALSHLRRRAGSFTVVQIEPPDAAHPPRDLPLVKVTADAPFAKVWAQRARNPNGPPGRANPRPPQGARSPIGRPTS